MGIGDVMRGVPTRADVIAKARLRAELRIEEEARIDVECLHGVADRP